MTLDPRHYAMLHDASAIADPIIRQRGYQSLAHPGDLIDLGFSKAQARTAPVLAIPLWDVHGQQTRWQIRPDSPRQGKDGKLFKYETPKGGRVSLDVHPSIQPLLGNPTAPIWIVEGVRKGDCLVSHGQCTIALMGGVWGFRGSNEHGGKVILPAWEHVALNGRLVYVAYDSDLATKPGVQAALNALWRFLRDRQAIPARVHWPEEFQQQKWGVDDFLAAGHTLDQLQAMIPPIGPLPTTIHPRRNGAAPPASQAPQAAIGSADEEYPYSDAYNALRLVQAHRHEMRYCPAWKTWLTWTGTHWQRDTTGIMLRWQRQIVKGLGAQLSALDDTAAKVLMGHIKSSLNTARLKAAVEQAHSWEGMSVEPEAFDADPWLLNVTNGTLDLHTGELRPHRQDDLITKCLSIPYEAHATCPTWDAFLWRIMGGSQGEDSVDMGAGELENRHTADEQATALIAFLRRAVGYSLSGSTREQCLFILYGITKTGKSTFIAVLRALLGTYGTQAQMRTFMDKERDEVRNDLADLAGMRMVCAVESKKDGRLDEGLVKQLTGGVDLIKARFLFQEHFTFKPQFKVFLATNEAPVIGPNDDAIWERIRRIPFGVHIPPDERDKTLDEKLLKELPGILAWAVQGCLEWQQLKELHEPKAVIESTQGYRDEMDSVARFLEECCRVHDQFRIKSGDLHNAFTTWCEGTGVRTLSLKEFGKRLDVKGFEKSTSNFVWRLGVTLRD